VNAGFKDRAYSGAGDLGDIADIAQQFMRQRMLIALSNLPKLGVNHE
jgi:hypothetical protein